jgi:tripartite-type tricarboxylate transporter receptor subunit TctC
MAVNWTDGASIKFQCLSSVRSVLLLCALFLEIAASQSYAQGWPTRPITIVVPFPAGGGIDVLARIIQPQLGAELGQPIVVENRPGAGGIIGTSVVARAAPDGYTLLLGNSATNAINQAIFKSIPYNPLKDFTAITQIAEVNFVLVTGPQSRFKSVGDVLSSAKQNPGQITYGSAGIGTTPHLAGEMFKSLASVDILHVPFNGVAPATVALLGGHIDLIFGDEPAFSGQISSGALKALGDASIRKSSLFPNLPTISESGLPAYDVTSWQGLFAPKSLPAPILEKVGNAIKKVLANTTVREKMISIGSLPTTSTPEEFSRFVAKEIDKWSNIVKVAGVTPQ